MSPFKVHCINGAAGLHVHSYVWHISLICVRIHLCVVACLHVHSRFMCVAYLAYMTYYMSIHPTYFTCTLLNKCIRSCRCVWWIAGHAEKKIESWGCIWKAIEGAPRKQLLSRQQLLSDIFTIKGFYVCTLLAILHIHTYTHTRRTHARTYARPHAHMPTHTHACTPEGTRTHTW